MSLFGFRCQWCAGAFLALGMSLGIAAKETCTNAANEETHPVASPAAGAAQQPAPRLRFRLTTYGEKKYHDHQSLSLELELSNVSGRRIPPATLDGARLAVELTDGQGKRVRVQDPLDVLPWEGLTVGGGLAAAPAIQWQVRFDHLQFLDPPVPGSNVRIRVRLLGQFNVDSNWLDLRIEDPPGAAVDHWSFPGVWTPMNDLVYRDRITKLGSLRALHVDRDGWATVAVPRTGIADPWAGRHQAPLPRERLDRLAELFKGQEAWKLAELKPEPINAGQPCVELAYAFFSSSMRCRFSLAEIKRHALLSALHQTMQELMAETVEGSHTGAEGWGPVNDDGLQCLLRANQPTWRLGETPTLEADVRNRGMRQWSIAQTEQVCELELNGLRYRYNGVIEAIGSPLGPGREYDAVGFSLTPTWTEKRTMAPLLLRGKYTARVAFLADDFLHGHPTPPSLSVSNPVTFVIDGPDAVKPASASLPLTLRLEVSVVGPGGKPPESSEISFWKPVDATAVKPRSEMPPLPRAIEPQRWHDRVTGKTWEVIHTAYGDAGRGAMAGLSPGDYRVTVWANLEPRFRAPQRPMIGLGQVIHLDGSQARTVEVVRLETGPSLAIRLVDTATGRDAGHGRLRLIRTDGLPVSSWSGLWHVWSHDGRFTYPYLAPGRYTLQVDGSTEYYGQPNYVQEGGPLPVAIRKGQNAEVTVRMKPAPFAEAEVRRRWPWIVTGKATDPQGKPLAGVTIVAWYGIRNSPIAGQAVTGKDGSYTVRFTGTAMLYDTGKQGWIQPHQRVVIWPSKPGVFERNLARQGELVVGETPTSRFEPWNTKPDEVLLPEQPRRIDFVMAPAAVIIEGLLVDSRGEPLADHYVGLNGRTLPPLSMYMVNVFTESKGEFQIDGVPPDLAWWFETRVVAGGQWRDRKSPSLTFTKPGRYRVKLQVPADSQVNGQLRIINVTDPQGAEVGAGRGWPMTASDGSETDPPPRRHQ